MKSKFLVCLALALVSAGSALAVMDNVVVTSSALNPGVTSTNTFVMRGTLQAVKFTVGTAANTNTLTITAEGRTLFSLTKSTGTNWYYPHIQGHDTSGTALTATYSTWNNITNSTGTYAIFGKIPVAGPITIKILNDSVIHTNTPIVELLWDR